MPRQRLLRALDEAADVPVTVVTGPPGAGKTTLLAQYAETLVARGLAAYVFTPPEGDEQRFLARLHTTLTGRPRRKAGTDALLGIVERLSGSATLIIDDIHLVEAAPTRSVMTKLVALLPRQARLVIAARTTPAWLLTTLRPDEVKDLGADELRFRTWEVEALFGSYFKEPLPPEDAAALSRETEGWAAGLRMFQLSTSGKPLAERRRAIAELWGKASLLPNYLTTTVLAGLPDDVVEFLMQSSALVYLDPTVCDTFLDRADSAAILDDLARRQLFTVRVDDAAYRYHAVLQGQLEAMLANQVSPARLRALHARAAAVLQESGHDRAAIRAWIRAGDWGAAEEVRQRFSGGDHDASALDGSAADRVADDPWVHVAAARRHVAAGRLEAARDRYRMAEPEFAEPATRDTCRRERVAVEAFLGIGAPYAQEHSNDWVLRLRAALRARPGDLRRTPPQPLGDGGRLAATVAAMLEGDFRSAEQLGAQASTAESEAIRLAARCVRQVAMGLSGGPAAAERLAELAWDADVAGQPWLSRTGSALRAMFDPSAADAAGEIKIECDEAGDRWGGMLAALSAGIGHALGERECLPLLDEAADRADELDAPVFTCWIRALQALVAAQRGADGAASIADEAARRARLVGVPAARAVVWLAEAALDPQAAPRLLALSREAAERAGWLDGDLADRPTLLSAVPVRSDTAPAPRTAQPGRPAAQARCFGGYQLVIAGSELDLRRLRPLPAAMLRLLSLHAGEAIHEEVLLEALWPDAAPERGRHNLQAAISSLRQFLEPTRSRGDPSALRRVGEAYVLDLPEPWSVDVIDFRQAIREWHRLQAAGGAAADQMAALRTAFDCYSGELLPAVGPATWVVDERERCRLNAATAAAALARLLVATDDTQAAIRVAERAVRIDPYLDHAWRVLIEIHEASGDLAALTLTRRRYTSVLQELGVEVAMLPASRSPEQRQSVGNRNAGRP